MKDTMNFELSSDHTCRNNSSIFILYLCNDGIMLYIDSHREIFWLLINIQSKNTISKQTYFSWCYYKYKHICFTLFKTLSYFTTVYCTNYFDFRRLILIGETGIRSTNFASGLSAMLESLLRNSCYPFNYDHLIICRMTYLEKFYISLFSTF